MDTLKGCMHVCATILWHNAIISMMNHCSQATVITMLHCLHLFHLWRLYELKLLILIDYRLALITPSESNFLQYLIKVTIF